ncbi:MAG: two-component regulator propeller domain-containing protein, partial [Bacteroidota bacterium]
MNSKTYILVLFVFLCIGLEGQYPNLNFFSLDQQQGLSDNSVTSIIKDSKGYFWFGTGNGLNRFDGYTYTRYFKGEDSTSIPENKIHSLFVSTDDQLWIGFENEGACRFLPESGSFQRYNFTEEGRSLASNRIRGFAEDYDSILYIASSEGVFYKKKHETDFKALALPDTSLKNEGPSENSLMSPLISAITSDESKGIWIAYENWWISHYNPENEKFRHFNLKDYTSDSYQTLITSLISCGEKLWLGTIGAGLIKYDPGSGNTESILKDFIHSPIHHIMLSSDETFWISGNDGLISLDPESNDYYRFTNILADNRSLGSTTVQYAYEDNSGILMIGTTNAGISYAFPNKQFRHMLVGLQDFYTLGHMDVTSILHDKSGNMWIGYRGGYIEMQDISKKKRHTIKISSLFSPNIPGTIFDIAEGQNGEIYCASWQGGLQKFNPRTFRFEPVTGSAESFMQKFKGADIRNIEIDKNGDLWLAAHGKGVYRYNSKNGDIKIFQEENESENNAGISNNWVYDICIDGDEYVWVTSAHGLSRISKTDYKIRSYYKTEEQSSLAHNSTTLAFRDLKGNIWIGTPNHLNLYIREADRFQRFDPGMSMEPLQIRSLIQDSTEKYWAGTSGGIIKFELNQNLYNTPQLSTIGHFDIDDGLQSESFNQQSVSLNSEGQIFFGGDKGIDYFFPQKIQSAELEPLLRIKNIELSGSKVYPGTEGGPPVSEDSTILLRHHQDMIGIEYVALNYFNNTNNIYSYMLEPLNSGWVDAGTKRELLFTNLEPGHYSLSLKVIT